jgi:hypothetical protein
MLMCLSFAGNTNSIFALDYISGALTLNGLLDRENPLYSHGFILTVKVRPGFWALCPGEGAAVPDPAAVPMGFIAQHFCPLLDTDPGAAPRGPTSRQFC